MMMSAVAFLTIFGRSSAPNDRTLWWFPVVGGAIGAAVAGIHWGAHQVWPPLVAGAIVLAADLVLTGALHLDGLSDSADGLLPHMSRERRLAVMAQPDVGAFALGASISVLIARWAVFASPEIGALELMAIWAISRTIVAVIPAAVAYARPEGLASPFLGGARLWIGLWLIPFVGLLVVAGGVSGGIAAIAAVATALGVDALAQRRLGGFTGDTLGAVILLSETAALLALAAGL